MCVSVCARIDIWDMRRAANQSSSWLVHVPSWQGRWQVQTNWSDWGGGGVRGDDAQCVSEVGINKVRGPIYYSVTYVAER